MTASAEKAMEFIRFMKCRDALIALGAKIPPPSSAIIRPRINEWYYLFHYPDTVVELNPQFRIAGVNRIVCYPSGSTPNPFAIHVTQRSAGGPIVKQLSTRRLVMLILTMPVQTSILAKTLCVPKAT